MKRFTACCLVILLLGTAAVVSQTEYARSKPPSTAPVRHSFGAIQPRISPDGERIAFSLQGAIWTMPTSGKTMENEVP